MEKRTLVKKKRKKKEGRMDTEERWKEIREAKWTQNEREKPKEGEKGSRKKEGKRSKMEDLCFSERQRNCLPL